MLSLYFPITTKKPKVSFCLNLYDLGSCHTQQKHPDTYSISLTRHIHHLVKQNIQRDSDLLISALTARQDLMQWKSDARERGVTESPGAPGIEQEQDPKSGGA